MARARSEWPMNRRWWLLTLLLALALVAPSTATITIVGGGGAGGTGVGGSAGSPLFVQTATGSTVNAASDTTILGTGVGSLTIPANWFTTAGTVLDVRASGVYTTSGAPPTFQLKLKLGGTTVGQTAA